MKLTIATEALTMSSREIAELCEKEHKNVMADIRKMLEDLGQTSAKFSADLPDAYGRKQPVFSLPKDLTLTLVAGYNVKLRKRIIDRWMELEAKPAIDPMQVLSDPAAMRGLLLTYTEKVLTLESKVGELAPKADALDRLATANGSFCIRDAAKTLQVQEKWLKQFMREHEWIYQRPMGHGWLAYADKLKQGVMEHKTTTGEKSDGSEWVDTQARITAKGMTKLSALIQESGQPRLVA